MTTSPYSVKEAAEYVDVSKATLRNYTDRYSVYLSSYANVATGSTRQYTNDDIAVLRYVKAQLATGRTHADILGNAENEFSTVGSWEPEPPATPLEDDSVENVIVPASQFRMIQALVEDERNRADKLQDEVNRLNLELGRALGTSEALRAENGRLVRSWWRKLLGM